MKTTQHYYITMKQFSLTIKSQGRGYYLITHQIEQALGHTVKNIDIGLLHITPTNVTNIKIECIEIKKRKYTLFESFTQKIKLTNTLKIRKKVLKIISDTITLTYIKGYSVDELLVFYN